MEIIGVLEEALKNYEEKKFKESFELFKIARRKIGEKEFDRLYSFKMIKAIYEGIIKNMSEIDTEAQNWILYILKSLKNKDFYYKMTIFKICDLLSNTYNPDYSKIIKWISKLELDELSEKIYEFEKDGKKIQFPSEKEKYFNIISKAYEKNKELKKAMEISKKALESLSQFTNGSDAWFNRRIAEYYVEERKYDEALAIYYEILKKKNDWFILKEVSDLYLKLGKIEESKKYMLDSILAHGEVELKVNLFMDLHNISKEHGIYNKKLGLDALKMYFHTKIKNNWKLNQQDKDLAKNHDIVLEGDNIIKIEPKDFFKNCKKLRWENEMLYSGVVDTVSDKFFFIKSEDGGKYHCKSKEYPNRKKPIQGTKLNFNLIETFDSKKNKYTNSAVNLTFGG